MRALPLLIVLFIIPHLSCAQDPSGINCGPSEIKQGKWIYYGKDRPELGYPSDGKIEEGNYVNNKKEGLWIKYHNDGVTPKLKGEYKNNRPNGKYTKFYRNGVVMETGIFSRGRYIDTLQRYHDNGKIRYFGVHDEYGNSVVDSFFYYQSNWCMDHIDVFWDVTDSVECITFAKDTCNALVSTVKSPFHIPRHSYHHLDKEIIYGSKGDPISPIATKSRKFYRNSELQYITYRIDSSAVSGKQFALFELNTDPTKLTNPVLHPCSIKSGIFKPNGAMRLYNEHDEMFVVAEFKEYQLWDGKVYIYDDDGVLLKVKVYKKGKYHSDGQL